MAVEAVADTGATDFDLATTVPPAPTGSISAPAEAIAVVTTLLAQAIGLAMQNVVSQQQALNTVNNAITAKALSLVLAAAGETPPKAWLDEVAALKPVDTTVQQLAALGGLAREFGLLPRP
ncbi:MULTISPECIES: RebB family R body protein [Nitrospirillum]|uniref:Killing trait domain-containing protein n=1 Tax=Nitrospirillum amazonense TaxID=28077 RepID=A0A560FMR9_9PROT|nr:RebB family R body protein [Nitrospirillum amazonense]MEC4591695.1 RebB family R body protein [Nitrospirillum amazonense]TWB22914.1 killing trait domain-containing protein [Nitrospirillum amazonense]